VAGHGGHRHLYTRPIRVKQAAAPSTSANTADVSTAFEHRVDPVRAGERSREPAG